MTESLEQQAEELEVLESIFEGDTCFKKVSPTCFQYMYGEDEFQSVLLEISWPETYPASLPNINLDSFHNGYLPDDFKNEIKEKLTDEASNLLDCAMTYSLLDWMKENADDFLARIPEFASKREAVVNGTTTQLEPAEKIKKERKEQLTKAQKRRITEQTNYKGERERGWNWVDVVKHLSQTGKT